MINTNIRDLSLNDLRRLEKEAKFPMPNLVNKLYCIKKSVEINGELAAIFWVKLTSELSLITNPDISTLKKALAIKRIEEFVHPELKKRGIDDMHLFIENDPQYSNFLIKNFGFVLVPGQALYIRRD